MFNATILITSTASDNTDLTKEEKLGVAYAGDTKEQNTYLSTAFL